ncbi:Sugar transporter ERD6-like 5, partial [Bienertia sinuspersici]
MVFQQFGGVNMIAFYATSIFESAGRVGTLALVAATVPMTVTGRVLMDRSGRRPLLMVSGPQMKILIHKISTAGSCLGCFLTGLSFLFQIFSVSFSLGMGGIPWVIMSKIFPMNVKGLAGSLVTVVNRFSSWIISFAFNFLMNWSSS